MKSMLQIIAAASCALALAACGGGSSGGTSATTPTTPVSSVAVQPALKSTDTLVGTGTTAAAGDLVVIAYNGWLYDSSKSDFKGAKVESSVDTGKAAPQFKLGVGQVISGWDQGIAGMKAGGKRSVVMPATLAYGAVAHDALPSVNGVVYAAIPANSALIYEIELVSVTKGTPPVAVTSPSDLVYVDTVVGTGASPTSTSNVTVNYKLYLFDGSRTDLHGPLVESASAASFNLSQLIPGWVQGVAGRVATVNSAAIPAMKAGGKRTLTIPYTLAYGTQAQLDSVGNVKIPAMATIVFEIELISVP